MSTTPNPTLAITSPSWPLSWFFFSMCSRYSLSLQADKRGVGGGGEKKTTAKKSGRPPINCFYDVNSPLTWSAEWVCSLSNQPSARLLNFMVDFFCLKSFFQGFSSLIVVCEFLCCNVTVPVLLHNGGFCNNCTPKRRLQISVHFQTNPL